MTGVLQNHSRKYEIPINAIDFSFEVLTVPAEDIKEGPEDGVICCGMFLEGARWDADNAVVVDSKVTTASCGLLSLPLASIVDFLTLSSVLPVWRNVLVDACDSIYSHSQHGARPGILFVPVLQNDFEEGRTINHRHLHELCPARFASHKSTP